MTENQYQPPTREQIKSIVVDYGYDRAFTVHGNCIDIVDLSAYGEHVADAVLALFPQPTPSAEPVRYDGGNGLAVFADAARRLNEGQAVQFAEPVGIADMATGTTLIARPAIDGAEEARFRLAPSGRLTIEGWRLTSLTLDDLDPSTIRDITPPPATPEAGR